MEEKTLVRFSLDFDKDLYDRIQQYADSLDNRPMAYVVRKAVQKYLDEQEQAQPAQPSAKGK